MGQRELRALYVISVAAELAGMHPQTLRIYERKGLVSPLRTAGRSRRYSDVDIWMLRRIQELTAEGVSLEGVKRIMALEAELEATRRQLEAARAELESAQVKIRNEMDEVHRRYRRDLVPLSESIFLFGPKRQG